MGYEPRRLLKFENIAGTISYTFPEAEFQWDSTQPLRAPNRRVVGAHYAYDQLGTAPGLFDVASETLRAVVYETSPTLVDTEYDNLASKLYLAGLGKIYTVDSSGVQRWAYARVMAMPSMAWKAGEILTKSVSLDFARLSSWFGTTAITHTEIVTSSPDTFNITNTGLLPAHLMTVRFRANTAAGFTNPKLENTTTVPTPFGSVSYVFESARDSAATTSELRFRTGDPGVSGTPDVGWSTDDGANYTDDFGNLVIPTTNRVLAFGLAVGVNSLRATIGGTPNVNIDFSIWPAYP